MSLILNFFGGPGIGKSTQSSELFSLMKKNHISVEITQEFPKIIAWEENYSSIKDQFYITANQHRNISRLYGKVDYIIVDSPIILGLIYKNKYGDKNEYPTSLYDEKFDDFLLSLFKKYKSLNILLVRDDSSYENSGRLQTLEESKIIDDDIKNKLIEHSIEFVEFRVNENTSSDIFNYIKQNVL